MSEYGNLIKYAQSWYDNIPLDASEAIEQLIGAILDVETKCDSQNTEIENLRSQLVQAKAYVTNAIASYQGDPADNNFQRGFLAALEVVRDEAFSQTDEEGK